MISTKFMLYACLQCKPYTIIGGTHKFFFEILIEISSSYCLENQNCFTSLNVLLDLLAISKLTSIFYALSQ